MWFQDWAHPESGRFDPAAMDAVRARGAMPMITWEPWDYAGGKEQPAFALARILAGDHDAWIRDYARAAARWGSPLYLRFAHEMNGDWASWSPGVNGNTSAQFVATWRYVVNIFREEGASNIRWVWSPSGIFPGSTPFADVFPGNGYVDWMSLNAFNFGTYQDWSQWKEFADIFAPSYTLLARLSSKPIMIAEMGSTEDGGDKARWITNAYLRDLPVQFPRLRAVLWYNEQKETDWRVNSSDASLAAYRQVVHDPRYRGLLP
jgi:beta-mannanase